MREIVQYSSKAALEDFLVKDIAENLSSEIEKHNKATLLLSGGSTPVELYKKLSVTDILWEKVNIGLVDERYVPTDNDFSNEKMLRNTLLLNKAAKAQFAGMIEYSNNLSSNMELVTKKYAENFATVSYCLLGMGADGHTASLFPNDKKSEASINREDDSVLVLTNAPTFPNRRISCGYNFLIQSKVITLMFFGEDKLEVLNNSAKNNLPISKFLNNMKIHYTK